MSLHKDQSIPIKTEISHNGIAREQPATNPILRMFSSRSLRLKPKITVQVFSHGVSIQHLGPDATSQQFRMDCVADGSAVERVETEQGHENPFPRDFGPSM